MAISLRERFADPRNVPFIGTVRNPRMFTADLSTATGSEQRLRVKLGYEAIPSTQVFGFVLDRTATIQATRRSSDMLAAHVAVALLGPDDTMGPVRIQLVHTADGVGDWHTIPAGRYWIVVACGMPIEIEIELAVTIRPNWAVGTAICGRGPAWRDSTAGRMIAHLPLLPPAVPTAAVKTGSARQPKTWRTPSVINTPIAANVRPKRLRKPA